MEVFWILVSTDWEDLQIPISQYVDSIFPSYFYTTQQVVCSNPCKFAENKNTVTIQLFTLQ